MNGVGDKNNLPYPEWLPNNSKVMKENFSLALKAADLIVESIKPLAVTDVDKVLRTAVNSELSFRPSSFSARGEWLNYLSHRLYIDVAHNPAALEKSLDFFISSVGPTYKKENHVAVLSLLADKDVSGILKVVFSKFSNVILFRADSVRGASIEDYKLALDSMSLTGVNLSILDDYDELEEKLFKKPSLGFSDIESLYFGGSFSAISQISKTIRSS
jgi:folylpolyglutamate synthase/dihydropteroate synthase